MKVKLITAPAREPLTLAEAKLHLRQDSSDDDEYIQALIVTARQHVEGCTRRKLLTQTWDYFLPAWPYFDAFKVPFGNLQSATSLKWKDEDGTETTLTENTDYLVETNGEGIGRIVLPYNESWPTGTLYPSNPITLRFVCGWTSPVSIPSPILSAMKLLMAKLYESRGEDILGQTVHEDRAFKSLLASARLWDEF